MNYKELHNSDKLYEKTLSTFNNFFELGIFHRVGYQVPDTRKLFKYNRLIRHCF